MTSPDRVKTYTTEVICLRAIDYGESDRILHLYAAEEGRISAIAKGAKRANSKLAGACERLNLSEVQLASGRSMDVLCQYQPHETFTGIRSDLLKLAYGMLFADLIYATDAANADSHIVFELLRHGLHTLEACPSEESIGIGLEFQRALLQALGLHPVLETCIFTHEPLDPGLLYYCFSPQLGGFTDPETRRSQANGAGHSGLEWVNVSTQTIAVLGDPRNERWTDAHRIKAQKFLRYYLKIVFEKDVHAYKLLFNIFETFPLETGSSSEKAVILPPTRLASTIESKPSRY